MMNESNEICSNGDLGNCPTNSLFSRWGVANVNGNNPCMLDGIFLALFLILLRCF